jgi:dihydroorotate dehydrogenase
LRANLPANVPIIGCGGISNGADALDFARAGASAVQMYTAFGYDGPGAARRVKDELVGLLKKEGKSWNEVVKESVGRTALKKSEVLQVQSVPVAAAGEKQVSEVGKLIKEAEEIERKLKDLEARS